MEQQDETSLGPETSQASGLILYLIESCQKALQLSFPGPENSLDITQVTGLHGICLSYGYQNDLGLIQQSCVGNETLMGKHV